jgi:hypothetical protein
MSKGAITMSHICLPSRPMFIPGGPASQPSMSLPSLKLDRLTCVHWLQVCSSYSVVSDLRTPSDQSSSPGSPTPSGRGGFRNMEDLEAVAGTASGSSVASGSCQISPQSPGSSTRLPAAMPQSSVPAGALVYSWKPEPVTYQNPDGGLPGPPNTPPQLGWQQGAQGRGGQAQRGRAPTPAAAAAAEDWGMTHTAAADAGGRMHSGDAPIVASWEPGPVCIPYAYAHQQQQHLQPVGGRPALGSTQLLGPSAPVAASRGGAAAAASPPKPQAADFAAPILGGVVGGLGVGMATGGLATSMGASTVEGINLAGQAVGSAFRGKEGVSCPHCI